VLLSENYLNVTKPIWNNEAKGPEFRSRMCANIKLVSTHPTELTSNITHSIYVTEIQHL